MIIIIKPTRKVLVYGLYIRLCLQLLLPRAQVEAKTAARSGLVATSQVGRGGSSSQGVSSADDGVEFDIYNQETKANMTAAQKLRHDLFKLYDKAVAPVLDYRDHVDVEIDLTYRQILDLDEKNQILKSLIWYRQYWTDQNLKWDPDQYDGMQKISIPIGSLWRPDMVVYEGVGSDNLEPKLPFAVSDYTGRITYSEQTILETTCSVDTSFFPFDSQKCSFTFVTWTQPVTDIDLTSTRKSRALHDESLRYFISTGEWLLQNIGVKKQIATYNTVGHSETESLESQEEVTNATYEETQYEATSIVISQDKTYVEIPADHKTTSEAIGSKLTDRMYTEVMFSIIIRRNSSLYMQSMLFPSILLTTVALLGFFLPPDSGERVGLQITILLTFMVFLLTVGEMFPASTGPYIGIYFVLSMAQLGVNIAMTIIVLYLHFKPCVRDKASWKFDRPQWYTIGGEEFEGESMIPVRTRRVLQFCVKYFNVADKGAAWMRPITSRETTEKDVEANSSYISSVTELNDDNNSSAQSNQTTNENSTDVAKSSTAPPFTDRELPLQNPLEPEVSIAPSSLKKRKKSEAKVSTPSKDAGKRKSSRMTDVQKIIDGLKLNVKDLTQGIKNSHEKDEDEQLEDSIEKEQEEWKSVARAVDGLFFRLYLFIMITSYIGLIGVAIHGTVNDSVNSV